MTRLPGKIALKWQALSGMNGRADESPWLDPRGLLRDAPDGGVDTQESPRAESSVRRLPSIRSMNPEAAGLLCHRLEKFSAPAGNGGTIGFHGSLV
jgi:hypothetical protein